MGVGGALWKRSVSPSGSSELNYRAANAVKIDSPQCAAGAAELGHPGHASHAPPPTPPHPRSGARLPSCTLTKGTVLPGGSGPREDVPASGTHRTAPRASSAPAPESRSDRPEAHPTRSHACISCSCRFNTHFTQRGSAPGLKIKAPFKRLLGVLFFCCFVLSFFPLSPKLKKKRKRKTQREAEPELPMTGSQRSQSNLPLLRTF